MRTDQTAQNAAAQTARGLKDMMKHMACCPSRAPTPNSGSFANSGEMGDAGTSEEGGGGEERRWQSAQVRSVMSLLRVAPLGPMIAHKDVHDGVIYNYAPGWRAGVL